MPSRPTDETFLAIVSAIKAIEADPRSPRTKAHLMRLAGIAHPTVHRAFKWDGEHGTPFRISDRWSSLIGDTPTRRAPSESAKADLETQLKEAREDLKNLRLRLTSAQIVSAAAWLQSRSDGEGVTSINRAQRG